MRDFSKGSLGKDAILRFQKNPAGYITELLNDFVKNSPTNWSIPFQHPYVQAPVAVAFGDGDSEEFMEIKKKYPWTLTPRECLENPPAVHVDTVLGGPKSGVDMPTRGYIPTLEEDGSIKWENGLPPLPPWEDVNAGADATTYEVSDRKNGAPAPLAQKSEHITCISFAMPIHPDILRSDASYRWSNSPELKLMSMHGAHIGFLADISLFLARILQLFGYQAIAPEFTAWGHEFTMDFQYEGKTSRDPISPLAMRQWAVASGLGTFGLHDMIITERGAAVCLGAVVTNAPIPASAKPDKEYCLYYRNGTCKKCIQRCPGQAISVQMDPPGRLAANCGTGCIGGALYAAKHDGKRMADELGDYAKAGGVLTWGTGGPVADLGHFPACGRCYIDVPCAEHIPDNENDQQDYGNNEAGGNL